MSQAGASKSDFKMPAKSEPAKVEAKKEVKKPQGRLEKALAGVKKGDGIPESYDLVLDYLISGGHAETVEEAHYIMLRLEADHVKKSLKRNKNSGDAGEYPKDAMKDLGCDLQRKTFNILQI